MKENFLGTGKISAVTDLISVKVKRTIFIYVN